MEDLRSVRPIWAVAGVVVMFAGILWTALAPSEVSVTAIVVGAGWGLLAVLAQASRNSADGN